MEMHISKDYDELSETLANWIVEYAGKVLAAKDRFSIVLTGGNSPKKLYSILAGEGYKNKIDWSRTDVFISDERFVPYNDERNNSHMIQNILLDHVAADPAHVHFMITENVSPETSANAYEEVLQHYFNKGEKTFDFVLLGMGDNAHALSLFPGHTEVIEATENWCGYIWLQEENMYRITLTPPVVNAAACIAFLVNGSNKAKALDEVLHAPYNPEKYPSQIIKPVKG